MFETILNLVKQSSNLAEFKIKLQSAEIETDEIHRLTVKNNIIVSLGLQLAKEKDNDRVEWVRELGANVSHIAQGYAIAGNHNHVETYRTQHQANVNHIAQGYAIAGIMIT